MASERIGVLTGLAAEARLARRADWLVAVGGGTEAGAALAARALLAQGATKLVSLGLAGGLDPSLAAGTVLVADSVLVGARRYASDPALAAWARATPCAGGTLFGVARPVASAAEKALLFGRTGAAAVDLESGPLAKAAGEAGLPFAAVRVICDPAWRSLPPASLAALNEAGAIEGRALLAALRREPAQLARLLALARDAIAARRALRRHIAALGRCAG